MSPSNHRRQPRGIREGGQFSASKNPEANVSLQENPMEGTTATQRVAHWLIRRYGLTNRELNGYISADDLTQDAALKYLVASEQYASSPADAPRLRTSLLARFTVKSSIDRDWV
jgi:hypothetical protein